MWEPRPGAKLMVCGVPEDASRRGAAPTGGGGACGACVGAPPRGEAFGCAVFLRFAARRGSYRGRWCLWCLRRSPAPGRSVWLCGVLAIRREARLLQGEVVPVVFA